jgi:putative transposase
MANTYSALHYHVIFSTKNREAWIRQECEERMWAYLGGIARENKMKPLCIGGTDNHVHLLVGIPPVMAVSKAIQFLKGGSSAWAKKQWAGFRGFGWQDGYAVFTVSKSQMDDVAAYIRRQREHHRAKTFEEEYREFLHRHDIDFDQRYYLG